MANWDNEIDNQIDDVARQMTACEPDPGFKARVLARIETVGTPRWSRRSVWAWSPLAVAAMALLAILIVRPGWKSEDAVPKQPAAPVRPSGSGQAGETPSTEVRLKPDTTYDSKHGGDASASTPSRVGSPSQSAGGVATRSYVASAFRQTGTDQANDAVAQAGDLAPPPIELDPIGVESMEAMESLQVPTLAVARIEVPPISEE
jgi:hypothetical protein